MVTQSSREAQKWECVKTYICNIKTDVEGNDASIICVKRDEFEPMTRQGPDCENCEVYKKWKKQREKDLKI